MILKQELISKIRDYFDLNLYETKVWLALLAKGIASAGDLASISGVPRSRTYDVLEGLEKKGFVIVKIEKPVKYLGVKPRMVLEKMKNNVKRNAQEKIHGLSNIKETDEFSELENLYNGGIDMVKREDLSASIRGKANISNHLKEILKNAKREVFMCLDAQDLFEKKRLFEQTFHILGKNNVKLTLALSGDEKMIKELEILFDLKIKKVNLSAKFFIIDRKEILFYLSKGPESDDIAIWLNSDFFAGAFASLFEDSLKKGV